MSMIIGNILAPEPSTVCKRLATWSDSGHVITNWKSPSGLEYHTIRVNGLLVGIGTGQLVMGRSISAQIKQNAHDYIKIGGNI